MQQIILLAIGTLKTEWLRIGCGVYLQRLENMMQLLVRELPASKQRDPRRQVEEESDRLCDALHSLRGTVWVLDERGRQLTSPAFAKEVSLARDRGDPMIFVVGGAYGFDDRVRDRAVRCLALSSMTLPHECARLFLLEQLYRAAEIVKGGAYHH